MEVNEKAEMYTKAAEQGNASAQFDLGSTGLYSSE
jgi:TPR repeat protein